MTSLLSTNLIYTLLLWSVPQAEGIENTRNDFHQLPFEYFNSIDKKTDQCTYRVARLPARFLTIIIQWENKIILILQNTLQETALRLIKEGKITSPTSFNKIAVSAL